MNIGFLHDGENELVLQMLRGFRESLAPHEVISWCSHDPAPTHDLVVLLTSTVLRREQMQDQTKLELIQTTGTGYERLDIEAATASGIWCSYAPSDLTGNATSVAEFAMLLLLGASRQFGQVLQAVHAGPVVLPTLHKTLNGKTVCIVGLGSIGRKLVELLRPFGALLLASDEHPKDAPPGVMAFAADKLLVALADADYVVICARASLDNEGLISAGVIRAMKRGAVLVNIARGSLVDEKALVAALKDGQISAVGLDVVSHEPLEPTNPMLTLPQALITPHIAAFTDLMLNGTVEFVSEIINQFYAGIKPKSLLNSPVHPRRVLEERIERGGTT